MSNPGDRNPVPGLTLPWAAPLTDGQILQPDVMGQLTAAQVINYLRERFETLRRMMATRPGPLDPAVSALGHLRWRNRFLMFYGRVIGSLEAAQAFGHIDVPQFQMLKGELLATMTWKMADVDMGGIG